jgi:hypothetical protein
MRPVHPGRILKDEIEARGLSANALALALRTPSGRITDTLNGKRGVFARDRAMARPLFRHQRAVLAQFADRLGTGGRRGEAWRA